MPQGRTIDVITISELFKEDVSGSFPILLDIQHEDIKWTDSSLSQEDGHLRLINAITPVKYNGHNYMAAHFEFTMPQEDGVKVSNTSITISAIDKRIVEIIRSIKTNPKAFVEAFYAKADDNTFVFSRVYRYEFKMTSCTWDSTTAQWSLEYDHAFQMNVPMDTATSIRCPSVTESESD